ncbi:MAG: AAA family ATPase [Paucimonas sp.]|jgi:predicted ATPase|nr:AAA family ATPase [Paucimonas sp.]
MSVAKRVVISGCSGGGKSTLLDELARRGERVVEEPGRRIVREQQARGGQALPWLDLAAFLEQAIALALRDRAQLPDDGQRVFFDRGLVDAVAALDSLGGPAQLQALGQAHRYHATVFLTPPWPQLFAQDAERRHDLAAALEEYQRLLQAYPALGYRVIEIPRLPVEQRADFVLRTLDLELT